MGARTLQPRTEPLSAEDRCDRCGARAYAVARLEGGGELLFCGHHFHEHEDAVRKVAVDVYDDTGKLLAE